MNTDATRQRMFKKLACSKEAERDRSLTRSFQQPANVVRGTAN
jgi:hypothetical protein